jgi:hypothetical protein
MSRNVKFSLVLALVALAAFGLYRRAQHKKAAARTVRCAVIGGDDHDRLVAGNREAV